MKESYPISSEPKESPSDLELESTPQATHITGLGIVRRDLQEFQSAPNLGEGTESIIITTTGSRPWCIVRAADDLSWRDLLNSIPSDQYLIHMIEATLGDQPINSLELSSLKERIKEAAGSAYRDQFTMYRNGSDRLAITSEDIHLPIKVASQIMEVIEYWLSNHQPSS